MLSLSHVKLVRRRSQQIPALFFVMLTPGMVLAVSAVWLIETNTPQPMCMVPLDVAWHNGVHTSWWCVFISAA